MKKNIILMFLFSFLILGCKKENVYSDIQMEIKNISNFNLTSISIKANSNNSTFDLFKFENIKINETKTGTLDLNSYKQLQDGNYSIIVYFTNNTFKETSFGYFTNKVDSKNKYLIEISNNDVVIK